MESFVFVCAQIALNKSEKVAIPKIEFDYFKRRILDMQEEILPYIMQDVSVFCKKNKIKKIKFNDFSLLNILHEQQDFSCKEAKKLSRVLNYISVYNEYGERFEKVLVFLKGILSLSLRNFTDGFEPFFLFFEGKKEAELPKIIKSKPTEDQDFLDQDFVVKYLKKERIWVKMQKK